MFSSVFDSGSFHCAKGVTGKMGFEGAEGRKREAKLHACSKRNMEQAGRRGVFSRKMESFGPLRVV